MYRLLSMLVITAVALALPAFADTEYKYAGEFLTHGVGARPLGMGGAFVAVADDVTAGYWNPAGVADVADRSVHLMHSETFGRVISYDTGAYVHPTETGGAFAVTVVRLAIDDIPFTDFEVDEDRILYDPSRISWKSDSEMAMLVTYAGTASDALRLGGNLKLIMKRIADYTCYGFGFDVGAKYDVWRGTTLGANIQDVTTTLLSWDTKERERILPTAKLGVAYRADLPSMDGVVTLAADGDFRFENRQTADEYHIGAVSADTHYGIEFIYRGLLGVRAGLSRGQMTAGAGVTLGGFTIDYAFGQHAYLDSSHRVSGAYVF